MNIVSIVGRLTRDPDIRYSSGEKATAIARFTVAVNRRFKNAEGNYDADFIGCVAYGKTAEMVEKYWHKGDLIGLEGSIRTGNYTNKDGLKVYTTEVNVNNVEFVGSKKDSSSGSAATGHATVDDDGFMKIDDGVGEELPF